MDVQIDFKKVQDQTIIKTSSTVLKGDKGDKGDKGEQGIQGIQGPKGDTGLQGIKGDKGNDGQDGHTPVKGIDYWTNTDKTEIQNYCKNYIDTNITQVIGGEY